MPLAVRHLMARIKARRDHAAGPQHSAKRSTLLRDNEILVFLQSFGIARQEILFMNEVSDDQKDRLGAWPNSSRPVRHCRASSRVSGGSFLNLGFLIENTGGGSPDAVGVRMQVFRDGSPLGLSAVPVPASALLLPAGIAALGFVRRRS